MYFKMGWRIALPAVLILLGTWTTAEDLQESISIHKVLSAFIPEEVIQEFAITIYEKEERVLQELVQPANIKIFIKLVKDSKIPKKGEIIKMAMSFMTKKTNKFESLVESMKRLDRNTAVEASVVFTQYLKVILPKILDKRIEYFNKFYNEDDIRKISGVLYDAFQQKPTDEILWDLRRVWRLKKDIDAKMALVRAGNFSVLELEWMNSSMAVDAVRDLQKFTNIEALNPFLPQLIEYIKAAVNNSIDVAWDEAKGTLNNVDLKSTIETVDLVTRQIKYMASKVPEYVDIEDIPEDVEKLISYIQGLDKESAKEKLEQLAIFMPSSDDIVAKIDKTNIPIVSSSFKEKVKDTVKIAANLTVPNVVEGVFISAALNQTKKINAKHVRFIFELIVNADKVDNEVYDALKHVFMNMLKKKFQVSMQFNASSFSDLVDELKKKISEIDDEKAAQIINEHMTDLSNIHPEHAAIIALDMNKIFRDLLHDDLLQKLINEPAKFVETVNRDAFKDLVATFVDTAKIMNETTVYKRCLEFSNYDKKDRKKQVEHIMKQVTDELTKVKHGNDVIRKFQIDDITVFLSDVVENGNVKNLCIDIKGVIKLLKMFEEDENEELTNLLWFFKRKMLSDARKNDNTNDIIDLLEAIHRVLLHQTGNNPDDLRVRTAMYFLKYFRNRAAKQ